MFPVCPGHLQDAPGSTHDVHGTDGPVDGLLPDSLIHVMDDEDGAPLFPGNLNKGAELPPYLVGGVDTRFLPDVGGEGARTTSLAPVCLTACISRSSKKESNGMKSSG